MPKTGVLTFPRLTSVIVSDGFFPALPDGANKEKGNLALLKLMTVFIMGVGP